MSFHWNLSYDPCQLLRCPFPFLKSPSQHFGWTLWPRHIAQQVLDGYQLKLYFRITPSFGRTGPSFSTAPGKSVPLTQQISSADSEHDTSQLGETKQEFRAAREDFL